MYAVIFEAHPAVGQTDTYLDIAADLRPELDTIPGFISIERFESLSQPGKVLSLSFWESEAALTAWRRHVGHREAQQQGRRQVFADYRLRVAHIERDYGLHAREQAPADALDRQQESAPWSI